MIMASSTGSIKASADRGRWTAQNEVIRTMENLSEPKDEAP